MCVRGLSRGQVGILLTGSHSHLLAGPLSAVMGTAGWVLGGLGRGEGCGPGEVSSVSTVCLLPGPGTLRCVGSSADADLPPARQRGRTPGRPLDPSLTQADRFLLVFRVCFCLAPFEIGYDVGGKAAASKPRPALAWKMDGQGAAEGGHAVSF